MNTGDGNRFALASALTLKTARLCQGLSDGEADILELVTPVTAHLLRWWFGRDTCRSRSLNFQARQRQAILNTIVAHEVLGATNLRTLYEILGSEIPLQGLQLQEILRPQYGYPCYRINAPAACDRVPVMQALLTWQQLNKDAALAQGRDDLRFTRRFVLLGSAAAEIDTLLDLFCGSRVRRHRDFATSAASVHADLLLPLPCREQVFDTWRNRTGTLASFARCNRDDGFIAIAQQFDRSELQFCAMLPDLMVVDGVVGSVGFDEAGRSARQENLDQLAQRKGRRLLRVDFRVADSVGIGGRFHPLNIIADTASP